MGGAGHVSSEGSRASAREPGEGAHDDTARHEMCVTSAMQAVCSARAPRRDENCEDGDSIRTEKAAPQTTGNADNSNTDNGKEATEDSTTDELRRVCVKRVEVG